MMGEIGGNAEEQAAGLKASGKFTKPLAAFIAGQTAPGQADGPCRRDHLGRFGEGLRQDRRTRGRRHPGRQDPAEMGSILQAALKG